MKTRNVKGNEEIISAAQFEAAMATYTIAEQREADINKTIEAEVNDLLKQYEGELQLLAQSKQMSFEIVQSYCINNKEALFGKRRSIGTEHGIAGFRLGTPRLKTTRGSNWNKVLAELKDKLPDYVRTIEEPAKDLLLADRNKEKVATRLMEIGVRVEQDELFYIETKKAA